MDKIFINNLVDFLVEQVNLQVWMQLCFDVHQHGLHAEFADFLLESPGLDMVEIDRQFRNEWDI